MKSILGITKMSSTIYQKLTDLRSIPLKKSTQAFEVLVLIKNLHLECWKLTLEKIRKSTK